MSEKIVLEKKATIDEDKIQGLVNWNPERGDPYEYETSSYQDFYRPFKLEILDKPEKLPKNIKSLIFNLHLKTASTLDYAQSFILMDGGMTYDLDRKIESKKPLFIYVDYPMKKVVRAETYPIIRRFDNRPEDDILMFDVGYIAWLVSKIYERIYKEMWKEVGIHGHGFDDLYLEELCLRKDNIIDLYIGS